MHELGIAQGILDRAREVAQANGAECVTALYVTITAAADFTEESLDMYLEMLTDDDDVFRGAQRVFATAPSPARCLGCAGEFVAQKREDVCPACGGRLLHFERQAPMVQLTDIEIDNG